jgi:hypothetical protein
MHSTLKLRESDPHDVFAIAPDTVPLAWADKVIADIARDANQPSSDQQPPAGSSAAVAAPTVDTNFRATTVNDLDVANDRPVPPPSTGSGAKSKVAIFLFALCSGLAAAAWQHYGGAAKQLITDWAPPFALTSSPPTEQTGLTGQPDTPAVAAAPADQAPPPQDASAAPPTDATAPAAAPPPGAAQLQSMARDVAAMGTQIEQLKASIAELKASQQAMAIAKPSEIRTSAPNPRPRISAPPPRSAVAPLRRPMAAYPPVQASAPLPQQLPPPALQQPAPPPPPARAQFDGDDPVVRPPMPLR